MRLRTLLQNITALKPYDSEQTSHIQVSGVAYDSRTVEPGTVFVAIPGTYVDGHDFLERAVQRGACAIVAQYVPAGVNLPPGVPVILVPDTATALADLASSFYGHPSRHLKVIGITGTAGKTTTTNIISIVLDRTGHPNGMMSTLNFKIGKQLWDNNTRQSTLEALEIQQMLAELRHQSIEYAVLETTSHALALSRVRGVEYDVGVITNITSEHLDFHKTLAEYWRAKARLFERLGTGLDKGFGKCAVLNADDRSYAYLLPFCTVPVLTYGIDCSADFQAHDLQLDACGSRFRLSTPDGTWEVRTRLFGRFNVYNCLAALTTGYSQHLPIDGMIEALSAISGIPGRLERIDCGQPFAVVVDYAHTPDSLQKVLQLVRSLTRERLIVVFGLSGERDISHRVPMGAIATQLADLSIFTIDDPREEDPQQIIAQIAAGAIQAGGVEGRTYIRQPDRRAAIAGAFQCARSGDTVLLAGKGHEQVMLIGRERISWDDRKVARELLGYPEKAEAALSHNLQPAIPRIVMGR